MLCWTCPECGGENSPALRECASCGPANAQPPQDAGSTSMAVTGANDGILSLAQNLETIHAFPLLTTVPEHALEMRENGRSSYSSAAATLTEDEVSGPAAELTARFSAEEDLVSPTHEAILVLAEETLAIPVKQSVDSLVRPLVESAASVAPVEPCASGEPTVAVEQAASVEQAEPPAAKQSAPVEQAALVECQKPPAEVAAVPSESTATSETAVSEAAAFTAAEETGLAPFEPASELPPSNESGEPEAATPEAAAQEAIPQEPPNMETAVPEIAAPEAIAQEPPSAEIAASEAIAQEPPSVEMAVPEIFAPEAIAQEPPSAEIAAPEAIAQEPPSVETAAPDTAAPAAAPETTGQDVAAPPTSEDVASTVEAVATLEANEPPHADAIPEMLPATGLTQDRAIEAPQSDTGLGSAEPDPIVELTQAEARQPIAVATEPAVAQPVAETTIDSVPHDGFTLSPPTFDHAPSELVAEATEVQALQVCEAQLPIDWDVPLEAPAATIETPAIDMNALSTALAAGAEELVDAISRELEIERAGIQSVAASFERRCALPMLGAPSEILTAPAPPAFEAIGMRETRAVPVAPPPANLARLTLPPQPPTLAGPCLPPELRNPTESRVSKEAAKARQMPGWVISFIAAMLVLLIGAGAYQYFASQNGASASTLTQPASPSAGTQADAIAKSLEISGLRLTKSWNGKQQVRFLIINHSAQDLSGVTAQVTVKSDGSPVLLIQAPIRSLASNQSKEIRTDLDSDVPASALSDWQALRTEIRLSSQQ